MNSTQQTLFNRLAALGTSIYNAANVTGTNKHGGLVYCSIPDQHIRTLGELLDAVELTEDLRWHDGPPPTDGYYWYHSAVDSGHASQRHIIVYAVEGEIIWPLSLSQEEATGRWYGPIVSPPQDIVDADSERPESEVEAELKAKGMITSASKPWREQEPHK